MCALKSKGAADIVRASTRGFRVRSVPVMVLMGFIIKKLTQRRNRTFSGISTAVSVRRDTEEVERVEDMSVMWFARAARTTTKMSMQLFKFQLQPDISYSIDRRISHHPWLYSPLRPPSDRGTGGGQVNLIDDGMTTTSVGLLDHP